jgi:putative nucleotidyltransferase with HDIG domain
MPSPQTRPRVGLNPNEPNRDAIRTALGERFELVSSLAERPRLWLIAPGELDATGVRALRQLRLRAPELPCIVITSPSVSASLVRDWYRNGAADVVGIIELQESLCRSIDRVLERAGTDAAREEESSRLEAELGRRAESLDAALRAVRDAYDQTLGALVTALDCRERETACHSQRVAAFAVYLGLELGLEPRELEDLYRGALLHDIGKIGIPDAVLLKPGALTDDEWTVMRGHSELGAEITRQIAFLKGAAAVPVAHHEAWDGTGYPRGLRGEEIPLHARIFAIADTYDALRSARPYKAACTHEEATAQMRGVAGTQLDPALVERFVQVPEATLGYLADAVEGTCTYEDTLGACRQAREL